MNMVLYAGTLVLAGVSGYISLKGRVGGIIGMAVILGIVAVTLGIGPLPDPHSKDIVTVMKLVVFVAVWMIFCVLAEARQKKQQQPTHYSDEGFDR